MQPCSCLLSIIKLPPPQKVQEILADKDSSIAQGRVKCCAGCSVTGCGAHRDNTRQRATFPGAGRLCCRLRGLIAACQCGGEPSLALCAQCGQERPLLLMNASNQFCFCLQTRYARCHWQYAACSPLATRPPCCLSFTEHLHAFKVAYVVAPGSCTGLHDC